ncbi:hypothetical protein C5S30_06160 [ANME-1 cluster archaeon GoMg4]|nr:hypothetical protein [ANME-1 cluster archaeon GoMg4]
MSVSINAEKETKEIKKEKMYSSYGRGGCHLPKTSLFIAPPLPNFYEMAGGFIRQFHFTLKRQIQGVISNPKNQL